jgi:hypothetical protein
LNFTNPVSFYFIYPLISSLWFKFEYLKQIPKFQIWKVPTKFNWFYFILNPVQSLFENVQNYLRWIQISKPKIWKPNLQPFLFTSLTSARKLSPGPNLSSLFSPTLAQSWQLSRPNSLTLAQLAYWPA